MADDIFISLIPPRLERAAGWSAYLTSRDLAEHRAATTRSVSFSSVPGQVMVLKYESCYAH